MAIVVATLTTVLPATLLHQVGVAGTLGVGTYLALVVTQDPRVRRSTVSVGLAVRRLVRSEGG